eukprot:jgi/Orpsp1_1/1182691/evm.model.c7180000082261.1
MLIEYANKNDIVLEINERNTSNGWFPFIWAAYNKNINMVKLFIDYANKNNITININEITNNKNSSLIRACNVNSTEIVKLILNYADENNIILKINDQNLNGDYPLLWATYNNNTEIVKLLVNYANDKNIILNINQKDNKGNYPLYYASSKSNTEIIKLLKDYSHKNNIKLEWDSKISSNEELLKIIEEEIEEDKTTEYESKLWDAIKNEEVSDLKSLLNDASENNIKLNINIKDENGNYPILLSTINNNVKLINILIDYAYKNGIILEINDKNNSDGYYPFLYASNNDNIRIVKQLIEYATVNKIIININDKSKDGNYPLLSACNENNTEIVKLILKYANENDITLDINDKNNDGEYPFLLATNNDNIEIARLLYEYAHDKNIILDIDDQDCNGNNPLQIASDKDNHEMIKLIKGINSLNNLIYDSKVTSKEIISIIEEEEMMANSFATPIEVNQINVIQNNELVSNAGTLVIAAYNFTGDQYNQLDIRKDEFLIVTDWNYGENNGSEWVFGHRKNNENEKGIFPRALIKIFKEENNETEKNIITPDYRIKFEKKNNQLRSLDEMKIINETLFMQISRKNLFMDTFYFIMDKTPEELKKRLEIQYRGEIGIDAGGLLRDLFYHFSKEIGNPSYTLFQYTHDDSYELEINPNSGIEPDHLKYFRFIGRMIGLAIFHKQFLSITFNILFYKRLLNKEPEFSDLEYIDAEMFKNLKKFINNDGAEKLSLTFEINVVDCFGKTKNIELKPNGSNINVTDENKNEYM